jgi:ribosomal protein S21
MATNVEVKKNNQESTANLIRRFTKRVQGSGILNRLRKHRYHAREKSPLVHRAKRLVKLENKVKYETLLKLGKIQETVRGPRGRK